jgi:iron complex outermembrane recepter protein
MRNLKLLLATTAVATMLTAQPAFAADGDDKGEIIVTARKQAESILKVPVVESVITEVALEHAINDITGVVAKIPGLVSGNAVLAIGEQMSLRGVGSNALDQGVDQSVSLNVDGLSMTHGLAYRVATFDLAQVEVFKGPQALYYGKNSTGGVISFRTADPTPELLIKGRMGYEVEAREARAELVVSGPITDKLGIRVAGLYNNSQGFFHNTATALAGTGAKDPKYKRFGGGEGYFIRTTLMWKPSDNFSARLKANFALDKLHQGGSNQLASCPDGFTLPYKPAGFPNGVNFYSPAEDCKYDRNLNVVDVDPAAFPNVRNGGTPFLNVKQNFGSLELNYDLTHDISLNSTTGLYDAKADTFINGSFAGYAAPTITADNIFKRRDISEEVRLSSNFKDRPINFMLGMFYNDGRISNDMTLGGNTFYGLPATFLKGLSTIYVKSFSVFGQLRWKPVEQLEFAGGARWTHEQRDLTVFNRVTNLPTVLAPGSDHIDSKNWSPEFTITWTPRDTLTIFGAFKQAYKSGSFNIVTPPGTGSDKHFGDEKAQGGEIGIKSRWLDRSLSIDLAGYYYRYKGLQTGVNQPAGANGLPVLQTINAGKAEVYGADFELKYRPPSVDGLDMHLAINWNKAHFLELNNVPCWGGQLISQGCNQFLNTSTGRYTSQDLSGVSFVRAPEWQVTFGADYEMPVGKDMKLSFGIDNKYSSSYLAVLGNRDDFRRPQFLKTDLSMTLTGPKERWEISLIGNNISNKITAGYCSPFDFATGTTPQASLVGVATAADRNASGVAELGCSVGRGREVWLRLGFKL